MNPLDPVSTPLLGVGGALQEKMENGIGSLFPSSKTSTCHHRRRSSLCFPKNKANELGELNTCDVENSENPKTLNQENEQEIPGHHRFQPSLILTIDREEKLEKSKLIDEDNYKADNLRKEKELRDVTEQQVKQEPELNFIIQTKDSSLEEDELSDSDSKMSKALSYKSNDDCFAKSNKKTSNDKQDLLKGNEIPVSSKVLLSRSQSEFGHRNVSSGDDSFLYSQYELHKEVIRVKLEMAQLQSTLDTQQAVANYMHDENISLKQALAQKTAERDKIKATCDKLSIEHSKLRKMSHGIKEKVAYLKNEKSDLRKYNEATIQRAIELEAIMCEKENIIITLMRHVEVANRERSHSMNVQKQFEAEHSLLRNLITEKNFNLKQLLKENEELKKKNKSIMSANELLTRDQEKINGVIIKVEEEKNKLQMECSRRNLKIQKLSAQLDSLLKSNRHTLKAKNKTDLFKRLGIGFGIREYLASRSNKKSLVPKATSTAEVSEKTLNTSD